MITLSAQRQEIRITLLPSTTKENHMNKLTLTLLISSLLTSTAAFASDDCQDPVANWQPKEKLQQQLTSKGWTVRTIKVDDGCYEVEGTDSLGNRFEAEYAPAALQIRKLEIDFLKAGDAGTYLDKPGLPQ